MSKPGGEKIRVWGYQVNLPRKPATTMKIDPDEEVQRWHWVSLSKDLGHIKDKLHVPYEDNILLKNVVIPENKSMGRASKFWEKSGKMGRGGFIEARRGSDEISEAIFDKEGAEQIKGGLADGEPDSKYPKDQLKDGIKVEKEHTTSKEKAKEIAKDHLEEHPQYYTHLEKMEKKLEKSAFWRGFAR